MSRTGIAFAIATVLFASRASAAEGDQEEAPKDVSAPLGAFWEAGPVGGKIMLQIGVTARF
jgi:hypothetical protein